ncbi:MAG TPA: response regulator [Blastocatellia bacterium]|nr:response regulator [Blastocatellia bacterium]
MKKASLLLAEDNADMRSLLKWLLESEGFTVIAAEDGRTAFQALDNLHPDVILTDLMMPGMDGVELIKRVRNTSEFAKTPIVAMTAYGPGYMSLASVAGADASIRKPEDLDVLVHTINEVLTKAAAGGATSH